MVEAEFLSLRPWSSQRLMWRLRFKLTSRAEAGRLAWRRKNLTRYILFMCSFIYPDFVMLNNRGFSIMSSLIARLWPDNILCKLVVSNYYFCLTDHSVRYIVFHCVLVFSNKYVLYTIWKGKGCRLKITFVCGYMCLNVRPSARL